MIVPEGSCEAAYSAVDEELGPCGSLLAKQDLEGSIKAGGERDAEEHSGRQLVDKHARRHAVKHARRQVDKHARRQVDKHARRQVDKHARTCRAAGS